MSRRQKRYERRQEKRTFNRLFALAEFLSFDRVISYQSLYQSALLSAKGVRWKESVQKYLLNIFSFLTKTKRMLVNGSDIRRGFIEFDICERGKTRHIRSVHFDERVVQKSLCVNALCPVLTYNLIADNGASQKGKGTHYAVQRLIRSLMQHYRKYGNSGYVLTIDFKSYFDNIEHSHIKVLHRKFFEDENLIKLADDFLDAFGSKGLGLGSETSQVSAVAYINSIDHYIKEVAQIKGYGRYMDDSYIIHPDKKYLQELIVKLKSLYSFYGIRLNEKKTQISKLDKGFVFLKTRFSITDTGKIIKRPCRDSITRERRRLKKHAKLYNQGVLDKKTIDQSFQSWLGSMKYRNARKTVYNMKMLYEKLFKKEGENK